MSCNFLYFSLSKTSLYSAAQLWQKYVFSTDHCYFLVEIFCIFRPPATTTIQQHQFIQQASLIYQGNIWKISTLIISPKSQHQHLKGFLRLCMCFLVCVKTFWLGNGKIGSMKSFSRNLQQENSLLFSATCSKEDQAESCTFPYVIIFLKLQLI